MFNPVYGQKLVQKLAKHDRLETSNSLKIKIKSRNLEWNALVKNQIQRSENTKKIQSCFLKAVGAISRVTNVLLELNNS